VALYLHSPIHLHSAHRDTFTLHDTLHSILHKAEIELSCTLLNVYDNKKFSFKVLETTKWKGENVLQEHIMYTLLYLFNMT
jgi:hypothetical protein